MSNTDSIRMTEQSVKIVMPKNRAETWNRLLNLDDMAMDHPCDGVIDEFEIGFAEPYSVQIKLCNSDEGGGGPWLDIICWDNSGNLATEACLKDPGEGPIEGEYIFQFATLLDDSILPEHRRDEDFIQQKLTLLVEIGN